MMIDAVVTHHGEAMTAQELNNTSYPLWKFCEHQLHFIKYNFYVWVTLTVHLSTNVGYKKLSFWSRRVDHKYLCISYRDKHHFAMHREASDMDVKIIR